MQKYKGKISVIYKRIDESYKLKFIACIVLSCIVIGFFLIYNKIIDNKYIIIEDVNFVNEIENISKNNGNITIKGYAFLSDIDSKNSQISVFLRNLSDGKEVWLDVKHSIRSDVDAYYNGDYNYENSGFYAFAKANRLHSDECYEIVIKIEYTNPDSSKLKKTVSSKRYIFNNELYVYNPKEFYEPNKNISSALLKNVLENGKLCLYQKDVGLYVYVYNGKMYWIATENFNFDKNGKTYITYHLYTSQTSKLSKDRIKYKYSNLDFYFEQHEYKEENTAPYRVAIRDVLDDFPITYIRTGVYNTLNKSWIWNKLFHIDKFDL